MSDRFVNGVKWCVKNEKWLKINCSLNLTFIFILANKFQFVSSSSGTIE